MIFSEGTWRKTKDLKEGYETYSEAFAAFLESDNCDVAVKEIVQLNI